MKHFSKDETALLIADMSDAGDLYGSQETSACLELSDEIAKYTKNPATDKGDASTSNTTMGCWGRSRFAVVTLTLQALFLILYAVFVKYDYDVSSVQARWFYPMFQNVHVMIFIGFGFLMTFLKKYGYGATAITFLIAALSFQWYLIVAGWFESHGTAITVSFPKLILADFSSAAILISFGAIIGKVSPLQLVFMAFVEMVLFCLNEWIAVEHFHVSDVGGSMVVHVFGAYFGLAVSRVINKPSHAQSSNEGSTYSSDITSMIGTLFLWVYWPSFNSAVAGSENQQLRAIINTYLALCSCLLTTFAFSTLTDKRGRLNMVHVQNATLAGGVAVGTAANMMIQPWGAILIGILAGILCTAGFSWIQPALTRCMGLHDSCGVNNLHGMPGLLAAVIGAVTVAVADVPSYNGELEEVFPMLGAAGNWTVSYQAAMQAATLGTTLGIALVGGLLTGVLLRFVPGLDAPDGSLLFSDEKYFEIPEDFTSSYSEVTSRSSEPENGNAKV